MWPLIIADLFLLCLRQVPCLITFRTFKWGLSRLQQQYLIKGKFLKLIMLLSYSLDIEVNKNTVIKTKFFNKIKLFWQIIF